MPEIAKTTECRPVDRTEKIYRTLLKGGYDHRDDAVVIDVLTDLRHFADEYGIDFEQAVMLSEMHYEAEKEAWKDAGT